MEDEVTIKVALENHTIRLNSIEAQIQQLSVISSSIQELTLSVNKLAINMENMLEEQKDQGTRIKVLETAPAKSWNNAKQTIITSILSTIATAVAMGLLYLVVAAR